MYARGAHANHITTDRGGLMGLEVFNPFAGLLGEKQQQDSWRWGTAVGTAPLRVQLDGDSTPLITPPDTLIPVLTGDRVRVHVHNRRATIVGRTESPTDKRTLPFIAGWTPYGGGYAEPTVRRDPSGRISLSGLCRPGTMTSGTYFSIVPVAQWAPGSRHVFPVLTSGGIGRVDVGSDGRLLFMSGTGSFVSLEGISWYPGE